MNYDILESVHPHLQGIYVRDRHFWKSRGMELIRNPSADHTLALIYEGNGTLEMDGKVTQLSQGMLFYLPAGSNFRLNPNKGGRLSFYSVIFHYLRFHWQGGAPDQVRFEGVRPLPIPHTLSFKESPIILELIRRMFEIWNRRDLGYRWKCKMEFQLLLELIMHMNEEPSCYMDRNSVIVMKAVEHIRNTLYEPFDRNALAEKFNVTPSYFSVIFKQYTGLSPVKFVTNERMDQAKRLLRSTQMKIVDIAEALGYQDSFYFTRLFSKEVGMPPSAYRDRTASIHNEKM